MAIPTLTSITPSSGLTIGETYVTIIGTNFMPASTGGRTEVYFGGELATSIGVVSSTELRCLTPGGESGSSVVSVSNFTPDDPNPEIEEAGSNTLSFTYARPDISTPADLSNHGILANITRRLIEESRRTVIQEIFHDMHPDYPDAVDATIPTTHLSKLPHIKITGPDIEEDPFYRQLFTGRPQIEHTTGVFTSYDAPICVKLEYSYTGVGRTASEVSNLLEAFLRFIHRNHQFSVPIGSLTYLYDLEPEWGSRATFRSDATRQGIYQFSGRFSIRGVFLLDSEKIDVTEVNDNEVQQIIGPLETP